MLALSGYQLWYYQKPIDFRCQIDGLMMLVDEMDKNPYEGVYIFRNKKSDKVKLLIWDRNGFWMMYKRMEKGRICFPDINNGLLSLTATQLQWMLSGIDIKKTKEPPVVKARKYA